MQGSDVPLVTFDVTRSYANNLTATSTGGQAPAGNHSNQVHPLLLLLLRNNTEALVCHASSSLRSAGRTALLSACP